MKPSWRSARPRRTIALVGAGIVVVVIAIGVSAFPFSHPIWRPSTPPLDVLDEISKTTVRIKHPDDIARTRNDVTSLIWPEQGFPADRLPRTETIDGHELHESLHKLRDEVDSMERLVAVLDYEYEHISYLLHPILQGTPRLVILHQGHQGGWEDGLTKISLRLLEEGFTIAAMQMPVCGWNTHNQFSTPNGLEVIETNRTTGHNEMGSDLEGLPGGPLRFFIEPVIANVNDWLRRNPDSRSIAMLGFSGGGWTTQIAAAVDPRIRMSVSVAGSAPLKLRVDSSSIGDMEQSLPDLYENTASWLDLYLLGSTPDDRYQIHAINEFDDCCFAGRDLLLWGEGVAEAANRLDGRWLPILDSTHDEHQISPWLIDLLMTEFLQEFPPNPRTTGQPHTTAPVEDDPRDGWTPDGGPWQVSGPVTGLAGLGASQ